ncbi:protein ENHANCED DISEASE RESISTANCE 2 isoform X2 [Manihot esculenta]|uniref:protein ENHANCED DISEASE RESISTANCE 2 isoform X2 n=1 Tax=Manihot esculenta TaxID=3983 RepID=UPI000B5D48A7|nr:protein ENHANCED DISEASE RESISTANCE 2 isoform X2 [Manihot esculenta]
MEKSIDATTTTTEVHVRKVSGGDRSERDGNDSSFGSGGGVGRAGLEDSERGILEYFGWVYHLGTNSIGREYCHLRFLIIKGKYVEMYKRDPHDKPGIEVYVIRFYNRLDETKKGEIACASAGEARKWMEAFDNAKQHAEYELLRGGSTRSKLNTETEINLEGHRPRIRRYAYGLKKLIRIGQGPEMLLRKASNLNTPIKSDSYYEGEIGDAVEAHEWKCVHMINGVRIFEDVSDSKNDKGALVKAVGVIDSSADTVFEIILSIDRHQRYEWDTLTGNLELLDAYDGHFDVVYGTYDPKYLTRWQSKRDFLFSRQWFSSQDGTYTILQFPAVHKKRPPRSGYRRTKINPSTWEIRNLNTPMGSNTMRCIVTQTLEVHHAGWCRWKRNHCSKFEKSLPYALLSQVAGLKEYVGANPTLKSKYATVVVHRKVSDDSTYSSENEDTEVKDEFYDAISADSSSSEGSDDEDRPKSEEKKVKLKNVSWAITSLALRRTSVLDANKELDSREAPIDIDLSQFHGSLPKGKDEKDSNCWTSPGGMGFVIRGKTYLKDSSKVMGGDPLLKLLAVDWFKVDKSMDGVALHPKCLVQTEAGKKLPFILVINLQIPAKPNYSLVLYYAAERPVNKSSLLGKFVDGTDMFRDSRFKLIPSIIEGYWMVKRAVGTKACLLGKAVTCKYLRQDNFLEIDVDIGSSSVARSVIGLVLGYVTSLVVDLAILIEAKEEEELPEYILGTVRLNRVRVDTAVPLEA